MWSLEVDRHGRGVRFDMICEKSGTEPFLVSAMGFISNDADAEVHFSWVCIEGGGDAVESRGDGGEQGKERFRGWDLCLRIFAKDVDVVSVEQITAGGLGKLHSSQWYSIGGTSEGKVTFRRNRPVAMAFYIQGPRPLVEQHVLGDGAVNH